MTISRLAAALAGRYPWLDRHQPRGSLRFQLNLKRDLQLDPLRGLPRFEALVITP